MKKTPLFEKHEQAGGTIVDFGGWALPIQYSGIIAEHEAVRNFAGLFDVSHMGEIEVMGRGALGFMQKLVTGNVEKLNDNQVLYTPMCYENGGVVDDLLVYRHSAGHFFLVVNASNTDKDFAWIKQQAPDSLSVENLSDGYAQLAIQGPKAEEILQKLTNDSLKSITFFRFKADMEVAGKTALVSRTGYTGEDGFEIYLSSADAAIVWDALLSEGAAYGLVPVGLGARDTLRFEAALPLYGHELSADITPLEAGLSMFVKWDKDDFLGKAALQKQKEDGIKRELIGFAMVERGVARGGFEAALNGQIIGHVTSGSYAPTIRQNLGLALIDRGAVKEGEELSIIIRGKPLKAKRVPLPFYKKRYKK